MIKRLLSLFLACVFALIFCGTVLACDEDQTNTYLLQILFGDSSAVHENEDNTKMLLNALYLCSEQSGNDGQEKIDYLKQKKVYGVPSLPELRIKKELLMECSHNSWEHEFVAAKKNQNNRKKVLQNTVNKVFDFGFLNNLFGSSSGKCNSFAAFLYYSHILSDYLADDPDATEVSVKGRLVPSYAGQAYVTINGNKPSFTKRDKTSTTTFEKFSPLDSLGRAGVAFAKVGPDTMPPSGTRSTSIGRIWPSGWNQKDGGYPGIVNSTPPLLYNRCHLIAHQLIGNDTKVNLITGTRYLNETGMKCFEDEIAEHIRKTGCHVLYRVTPIYQGDNLIASGVQIEAYSIEDNGEKQFNVYCYNVQPGVGINYANGENELADIISKSEKTLPFAVYNANDNNPDLIFEMNKHLEILFAEQSKTNTYKSMINQIEKISDDARSVNLGRGNEAQQYIQMKRSEYQYLEILTSYIPILLSKEDFFKSAFK